MRAICSTISAFARADVMGYSMGARIGAYLALANPDRVRSLILGGLGDHLVNGVGLPLGIAQAMEAASLERCHRSDPADVSQFRRSQQKRPGGARRLHPGIAPDDDGGEVARSTARRWWRSEVGMRSPGIRIVWPRCFRREKRSKFQTGTTTLRSAIRCTRPARWIFLNGARDAPQVSVEVRKDDFSNLLQLSILYC